MLIGVLCFIYIYCPCNFDAWLYYKIVYKLHDWFVYALISSMSLFANFAIDQIMSKKDTKIFDIKGLWIGLESVWLSLEKVHTYLMWPLVWPKVNLTILGKHTYHGDKRFFYMGITSWSNVLYMENIITEKQVLLTASGKWTINIQVHVPWFSLLSMDMGCWVSSWQW